MRKSPSCDGNARGLADDHLEDAGLDGVADGLSLAKPLLGLLRGDPLAELDEGQLANLSSHEKKSAPRVYVRSESAWQDSLLPSASQACVTSLCALLNSSHAEFKLTAAFWVVVAISKREGTHCAST